MTRVQHLVIALLLGLVPGLALLGDAKGQGGKGKDDALIAGMKFVKVPKGTFWMGWDSDTETSKQVEIKQDFELASQVRGHAGYSHSDRVDPRPQSVCSRRDCALRSCVFCSFPPL